MACRELELPAALASDGSVFSEGFQTPRCRARDAPSSVPWSSVREVMTMARDALRAKQRAAERLAHELERLKHASGTHDQLLLQRAQRAEVDCGSLLDELQQLIRAKSDAAQQRADLDRANALLMAERELLCEQLQVSPDNVNLCHAVSKVLAAAKRARALDAQLRLLAKCQREVLLQLEATRQDAARSASHWQACEQVYLDTLAAHGIPPPQLPSPAAPAPLHSAAVTTGGGVAPGPEPTSSSAGTSSNGGGGSAGSSGGGSSLMSAQLMLLRMASGGAAAFDGLCGSPASSQAHMLPPTPPVSELHLPPAHRLATSPGLRRSHSLDSAMLSLTGLLDQLALGQLGREADDDDGCGLEECEPDSDGACWMLVDAMSAAGDDVGARGQPAAAAWPKQQLAAALQAQTPAAAVRGPAELGRA